MRPRVQTSPGQRLGDKRTGIPTKTKVSQCMLFAILLYLLSNLAISIMLEL